jgi:hypothetical protein
MVSVLLPNGQAQARRGLRVEPLNSACPTKPNRAARQGREAASPAASCWAAEELIGKGKSEPPDPSTYGTLVVEIVVTK